MDFARQQRDPTKHMIGITCVILLHVLVIYALVTGLASKAIQVIKKPLNATIVEEIKVPPPPPPPPPPKKIEIPKAPPPPEQPYVPPPDIPVPVTPAEPVIAAVSPTPPPTPPVIAPPAPPAPPPPKVAQIVRNPKPLSDCSPDMPAEARRKNIEGSVVAQMLVDEKGNVTEVKIVKSSDRVFEKAVIRALSECKFHGSGDRWIGEQEIDFTLQ